MLKWLKRYKYPVILIAITKFTIAKFNCHYADVVEDGVTLLAHPVSRGI